METISKHQCFGGTLGYYRHDAAETKCPMRFSLFLPPAAKDGPVPVLYFLSGLTCTEENFTVKAGAYRKAAELGLAVAVTDTSPRGPGVPTGDDDALGFGAGFYVDATQAPWAANYRMESYVTREFPALLAAEFPMIDTARAGIFGHSMGGHGALTLYFRHRALYRSVSAFAPICSPMESPWAARAFGEYLGSDRAEWARHDASRLALTIDAPETVSEILIDQGMADPFMAERLKPELFEAACRQAGIALRLRRQDGYDHGYFFIQSFIDDHLEHHAGFLR